MSHQIANALIVTTGVGKVWYARTMVLINTCPFMTMVSVLMKIQNHHTNHLASLRN